MPEIEITKSQLADEVLRSLFHKGLLKEGFNPESGNWTDTVLDVQDIFSNYWDEKEPE